jgi:hypothetical protein
MLSGKVRQRLLDRLPQHRSLEDVQVKYHLRQRELVRYHALRVRLELLYLSSLERLVPLSSARLSNQLLQAWSEALLLHLVLLRIRLHLVWHHLRLLLVRHRLRLELEW